MSFLQPLFKCTKKVTWWIDAEKLLYRVAPEHALSDITSKSNLIKILNGFCVLIKDGE